MTEVYKDATREQLMKNLLALQNLQQDGINVGSLPEDVWNQIVDYIKTDDTKKLAEVRERLKNES
jgi:hypothetical protein